MAWLFTKYDVARNSQILVFPMLHVPYSINSQANLLSVIIYWPTEITRQLFFRKFLDENAILFYCI